MPATYGQNIAVMVYMRPELTTWIEEYTKEIGTSRSAFMRSLAEEHRRKVLAERRAARRQRRKSAM